MLLSTGVDSDPSLGARGDQDLIAIGSIDGVDDGGRDDILSRVGER